MYPHVGEFEYFCDMEKQILKASYISTAGNGILAAAKIITGFISGSVALFVRFSERARVALDMADDEPAAEEH